MTDENQNRDRQAAEHSPLDRELDAALAKYAAVEARTGLEERVLAHLHAASEGISHRSWWRWGVALVCATLVIVVTFVWRSGMQRAPVLVQRPPTATPGVGPRVASNGLEDGAISPAFRPTTRHVVRRAQATTVAQTHPKLDQFPAPQPLSEQEKILASYVEHFPERAVLLARARTAALRQDQLEETQAFPSTGWPADSDKPNSDKTNR